MSHVGDPVVATLAEALAEAEPRPTMLWGRGLASVSWQLETAAAVRYVGVRAEDARGVRCPMEQSLVPAPGAETRIVATLPRSKDALAWVLAVAGARLQPDGELWMAGHKREGIRAAARLMEEAIGPVVTARTKRHCRVLIARRGEAPAPEPRLEDHERRFELTFRGSPLVLHTFPGTFAHGRLDEGTRRLLDWLATDAPPARVLDLGCGAGVIGLAQAAAGARRAAMIDASIAAVASARRSLDANPRPGVTVELGDVDAAPAGPFDLVLTNPPFHSGREEDRGQAARFAEVAAQRLVPGGRLVAVANRHLGYRRDLETHFTSVDVPWEDRAYRIWECRGPRR